MYFVLSLFNHFFEKYYEHRVERSRMEAERAGKTRSDPVPCEEDKGVEAGGHTDLEPKATTDGQQGSMRRAGCGRPSPSREKEKSGKPPPPKLQRAEEKPQPIPPIQEEKPERANDSEPTRTQNKLCHSGNTQSTPGINDKKSRVVQGLASRGQRARLPMPTADILGWLINIRC